MKEQVDNTSGDSRSASSSRSSRNLIAQIERYQVEVATHRRKLMEIEAELHEVSERYCELYYQAPVGFLSLDSSGRIRELNDISADLLGFPRGWLIDKPFLTFIHKSDVRRFVAWLVKTSASHELHSIRVSLAVREGLMRVHITTKVFDHDKSITHRLTIVDMSELRSVASRLEDSLIAWRALVRSATDVMMKLDASGRIVFVNRPVFGWSPAAIVGCRIVDYLVPEDTGRIDECISQARNGTSNSCEIQIKEHGGWYSLSFAALRKEGSGRSADENLIAVTIRDISDRRIEEERLRADRTQLREVAARIEAAREEERTRLSREIHDELGQSLTILKMDLAWIRSRTAPTERASRKRLRIMDEHITALIESVRRIASDLRPPVLDDLGLMPAIEWQVAEFQKRSGIRCELRGTLDKVHVESAVAIAVFRILQESLTNVARHASASNVRISFETNGQNGRMCVSDDGCGMADDLINSPSALGLIGMRERIFRVGGSLVIQSRIDRGTKLEVTIPTKALIKPS